MSIASEGNQAAGREQDFNRSTNGGPDPKAVTVAKMDPIFEGNCPLWTYVLAEATPHKHIDFAGEHLAEDQGVMEGAVDTGHEAAHAILKRNPDDAVLQIE